MGIADRSAYDLTCHAAATKTKLTAEAPLDKPITVETYSISKKALAAMGKEFKKDAKAVGEHLQAPANPPLPPPPLPLLPRLLCCGLRAGCGAACSR